MSRSPLPALSTTILVFLVLVAWFVVVPPAVAQLPSELRDAVAALEAENPDLALERLDAIEDAGDNAGRVHYARAVALAQKGTLVPAACAWSQAVHAEPGLAEIDPSAYPKGAELAAWLGLDGSLPTAPEGARVRRPEPESTRLQGPYTGPVIDATESGTVAVYGLVRPDGRFVVRRVEADDPALASFVISKACFWSFEPATVDGEAVAAAYGADLGTAEELLATVGLPLELESMELPARLDLMRTHLLAERWRETLDVAQAEPDWFRGRDGRDVAVYYLFQAIAAQRLGDREAATCQWAKARFAEPGIVEAVSGRLPSYQPYDPETEPRQVGGVIRPPTKKNAPDARYTDSMRKRRVQGMVIAQAVIERDGRIGDLRILKADDPEMALATLDAICEWTFEPATLDGEPVPVYYNLTMNFRIQ